MRHGGLDLRRLSLSHFDPKETCGAATLVSTPDAESKGGSCVLKPGVQLEVREAVRDQIRYLWNLVNDDLVSDVAQRHPLRHRFKVIGL